MARRKVTDKARIHAVLCCWEWAGPKRRKRGPAPPPPGVWKLHESFAVDEDGCRLDAGSREDRDASAPWMFERVPRGDGADHEYEPVMGRCVTAWTVGSGVRLHRLHPPEYVPVLGCGAYERLCKSPDWAQMVQGGGELFFGTEAAVRKILFGEEG